jgi:ABC-type multidrug transport system fused ATPase/permease subunit
MRLRSFLLALDMKPGAAITNASSASATNNNKVSGSNSINSGSSDDVIIMNGTYSHIPMDTINDNARARLLASSPAAITARTMAVNMERSRSRSVIMGNGSRTVSATSSFAGFDPTPNASFSNNNGGGGAVEAITDHHQQPHHSVATSSGGITSTIVAAGTPVIGSSVPTAIPSAASGGSSGTSGHVRTMSNNSVVHIDGQTGMMSLPPSPSSARFTVDISPTTTASTAPSAVVVSSTSSSPSSTVVATGSPRSMNFAGRARTASPLTRTPHLHVGIHINDRGEQKDGPDEEDAADRSNRNQVALWHINVSIKRGQLIGVVGAVGSGKSNSSVALLISLMPIKWHHHLHD